MNTHQITHFATTSNPLETFISLLRRLEKSIRDHWIATRSESIEASLPQHLRYDIGDLDCRPLRSQMDETPTMRQTDLESLQLRYGR